MKNMPCGQCARVFPEDLLPELEVGDTSIPCCALCALRIVNHVGENDYDHPFDNGIGAQTMYVRCARLYQDNIVPEYILNAD